MWIIGLKFMDGDGEVLTAFVWIIGLKLVTNLALLTLPSMESSNRGRRWFGFSIR